MEETYVSIHQQMNGQRLYDTDIQIYNGMLFIHKKERNNAIRDYHTKWSKSERERQMPYGIIYTWNLKYDTNGLIHKTKTDSWT